MEQTEQNKSLVLGTLECGLSYIADYIVSNNSCHFTISNAAGSVLFEQTSENVSNLEESAGKLTYAVNTKEGPIVLSMDGLTSDMLEQGMNSLKEVEFPIQC